MGFTKNEKYKKEPLIYTIHGLVFVGLFVLLFCVVFSSAAYSQDDQTPGDETTPPSNQSNDVLLDEIVVTAPRPKPTPARRRRRVRRRRPPRPVTPPPMETVQEALFQEELALDETAIDAEGSGAAGGGQAAAATEAGDGAAGTNGQGAADGAGGPASAGTEPLLTGDVNPEYTPAFYSVIERDQFEGKMESLAEVIAKESGVQIRQAGGLGSYSEVSIRGSSSEQVMVYMDGVLLNDGSGGGVDLSNISLADVQDIEIYRGVTPVNFGKASVGGVINIRTLRAQEGFKASVGAGYGSFNTTRANGFVNHKPGKWDYLVSLDWVGSDNDFKFLNKKGTDYNTTDDRWEHRNNDWLRQYNMLAKTGYDFTNDFRLDFVEQFFSKDKGMPNWINSPQVNTSLRTKRNIATIKLTHNNLTDLGLNTSLRVYHNWKEEEYDDRGGYIGLGKQNNRYTTTRVGGALFMEWPTTYQVLSFNGDLYQEEYNPENLLSASQPQNSSRDYASLALQDSLLLFNKKLVITPALRYTRLKDKLRSGTNVFGVVSPSRSRDKDYLTPQIGLKYKPFQWLTLKSNLAEYVREPAFYELFGDRGFSLGNEDLKAEKGVNFDLGFIVNYFPKKTWVNRLTWRTTYFRSDVDDLITRVYDARGVGRSENISSARIQGLETELKTDIFKYFSLIGNATWQNPENHSQISAYNGKTLPGRFTRSYLGRLEGKYLGFKVYGEYIFEDGRYYDTANLVPAKERREANVGLSLLYRSFLFSLDAKNITNEQNEDFNRFPLPGRSFFFSVKKDF